MGWRLVLLDRGYGRIDGGVYTLFLVLTDEVSEAERDDFLRIFSHHDCQTDEATMQDVKELEGYEEMVRKFASGLTPEQALGSLSREKLRGHDEAVTRFLKELPVEQRLADLSPEQRLLAMPDDALRALPDAYLGGLPADVQSAIRKRIGRPSA